MLATNASHVTFTAILLIVIISNNTYPTFFSHAIPAIAGKLHYLRWIARRLRINPGVGAGGAIKLVKYKLCWNDQAPMTNY